MSILLKNGDYNTKVALWQGFLNSYGYKDVVADAHFGPKTIAATRGFQAASGLRADGIVGSNTIAAAMSVGFAGFDEKDDHVPDAGKLILISAGHTNNSRDDRGVGANGYIEGVETTKLRDAVAEILLDKGCSVIKDGVDGVNEPLKKALLLAKSADVAVEMHFNASANVAAHGVECLSKPNLKGLSQHLANAVADAADLETRGEKGWKADNSGQHHRLAFCEAGGAILEVCFLTSLPDVERYSKNFDAIAQAIADVMAAY